MVILPIVNATFVFVFPVACWKNPANAIHLHSYNVYRGDGGQNMRRRPSEDIWPEAGALPCTNGGFCAKVR